jgi:putative transposase
VIHRAFRYRLYPTAEQASAMEATANARRFIYNLALEQRNTFWRQAKAAGVYLNFVTQGREVTELRRQHTWLSEVASVPLLQTLRDLDKAFSAFFSGRSAYPSFQSKDRHTSFRHKVGDEAARIIADRVHIPKIGAVRARITRPLCGRPVSVTFSRDALGWHAAFVCEIEHEALPSTLPAIGIDRGVANTLTLSNGEMLSTPDIVQLDRRKRKAQRILARRQRGSNRYRKQLRHVQRAAAKIARVRREWQHRASTNIARRFGAVALEDLNVAGMTRKGRGKRGLNRNILEQGWSGLEAKLAYKLEERGGTLIKINPAYTSQECSACGVIDKASRKSQASFACRHCGFAAHADVNAATNILRRSTPVVEGSACAPVETRPHVLAA